MSWPTFVTVRDRVRDLRVLVPWLAAAGADPLILLDCGSTWPPCLAYLAGQPHPVVRLPNLGPRAAWIAGLVPADRPYVVTDSDLQPAPECPADLLAHLDGLLAAYPAWPKAGPGLALTDLGADDPRRPREEALMADPIAPGIYGSQIDTTLALYRPGVPWGYPALRTGTPYLLRHPSWAVTAPDAEDRYYLAHARPGRDGSGWAADR